MGLKFVPDVTHIPFTKLRLGAFALSAIGLAASVYFFFSIGLNFGIDFKGGIEIEVGPADGKAFSVEDIGRVRTGIGKIVEGEVKAKSITSTLGGAATGISVTLERQTGESLTAEELKGNEDRDLMELAQQIAASKVQVELKKILGDDIHPRKVDVVGPSVSGELVQTGVRAVIFAVIMMLVYIWFRFEWQFSLGAVIALIHDVILTIGMFAVTQLDFGLSIIAALLTIIGYSMNDTVVVYDRVRENLRRFKKKPLMEILDLSINDTLSRTIMTSVTTLLALGALLIFGGPVLRGFTAAMMWGVVIGTYSSIFIAAPILQLFGVKRDWSPAKAS